MNPQILEKHETYLTNEKGEKIAVVISIQDFEELKEDMHDLQVIAQRKNEKTVSFNDMKSKFI